MSMINADHVATAIDILGGAAVPFRDRYHHDTVYLHTCT
jgi:hypothetical protein